MAIELNSQDQVIYLNINDMFKVSNRAAILVPSGHDNSYLYLKWIEDHPQDTFIIFSHSSDLFLFLQEHAEASGICDFLNRVKMISFRELLRMSDDEVCAIPPNKIVVDEFQSFHMNALVPIFLYLENNNIDSQILYISVSPKQYETLWNKKFELYKEFKTIFGRDPDLQEVYKDVNLGKWVSTQRQFFKKKMLSEKRIQLLLDVGFIFDVQKLNWLTGFNIYKLFKTEYGWEPKKNEIYKGFELGAWLSAQRKRFNQGKLSQDRIQLLMEYGFLLNVNYAKVSYMQTWSRNFELYKEFKAEYGREPKDKEIYKGVNIGNWVTTQRKDFKDGSLPEERKQILLDNGFVFYFRDEGWLHNLELYKEFKAEYGREPKQNELYHGVNLKNWVANQRAAYRRGELSQERILLLGNCGFIFRADKDISSKSNNSKFNKE